MSFRLEKLITILLNRCEYSVVDGILENLDIDGSGNCFTDLVDIVRLCNNDKNNLESLGWFKQRLSHKILVERGEEAGKILIDKMEK